MRRLLYAGGALAAGVAYLLAMALLAPYLHVQWAEDWLKVWGVIVFTGCAIWAAWLWRKGGSSVRQAAQGEG